MKRIYLFIFGLLMASVSVAQNKVPQGVKFNFETMFPSQTYEQVYSDSSLNYYFLFKQNSQQLIARYSKEGYWQFTGSKLKKNEIPEELNKNWNDIYMKNKLWTYSVYQINTPYTQNLYYIEMFDGKTKKHYIFNQFGVLLNY
jgi:hypothetical protein